MHNNFNWNQKENHERPTHLRRRHAKETNTSVPYAENTIGL